MSGQARAGGPESRGLCGRLPKAPGQLVRTDGAAHPTAGPGSGCSGQRKPAGRPLQDGSGGEYIRVGALPVSGSVLDVSSSRRVPPGTAGPPWWEAASVSSTASHAPHGSSRTSWAPWTSSEQRRHPPVLARRHPAPHAVHGRLLPSKRHFKFAPLEIFAIKPLDGSFGSWWVFIRHCSIAFGLSCFLVLVNMDHGLSSPLVHLGIKEHN